MAAKHQQLPQLPWFLTEVTYPRVTILYEEGGVGVETAPWSGSKIDKFCLIAVVFKGKRAKLSMWNDENMEARFKDGHQWNNLWLSDTFYF